MINKIIRISKTGLKGTLIFITAIMISFAHVHTVSAKLVQPEDFKYLGAFKLPGGDMRPQTFAWSDGGAITFNPDGDPSGKNDGFPGSLFMMGHVRMPYGELPNGNQIAEVSIPKPVISKNPASLPQASFVQGFHNVLKGRFTQYEEIPRAALLYFKNPATGAKIHIAFGQHFHDPPANTATHAWIEPTLSSRTFQGPWFIGNQSLYSVNGYMFEIPTSWADRNTKGRYIATGRFRDGGWSGQGPALFAYRPWTDSSGKPAPSRAHLKETTLLLYASSTNTEDVVSKSLKGYQHPDEWEGGAWITTASGKTAVMFAGTKSTGTKYWYGWVNPKGPNFPCVETEMVGSFPVCRLANGSPCPPEDLRGCKGHNDFRGWWSTKFDAQFILYDPGDFAKVAVGQMASWKPQPYAVVDIDDSLLMNPNNIEKDMIGTGVQRKYRIGDVAFDRNNSLIYVVEPFADQAKPVIHVWRVADN